MKAEIKVLISTYKKRIAYKQKKMQMYESSGRGGACIALQGEIQAYNAVISDLEKLLMK